MTNMFIHAAFVLTARSVDVKAAEPCNDTVCSSGSLLQQKFTENKWASMFGTGPGVDPNCDDTPNWNNGAGFGCDLYKNDWCSQGWFRGIDSFHNYPGQNCCECGKLGVGGVTPSPTLETPSTPMPATPSTPRPATPSTPMPAAPSTPRPATPSTPRPATPSTPRPTAPPATPAPQAVDCPTAQEQKWLDRWNVVRCMFQAVPLKWSNDLKKDAKDWAETNFGSSPGGKVHDSSIFQKNQKEGISFNPGIWGNANSDPMIEGGQEFRGKGGAIADFYSEEPGCPKGWTEGCYPCVGKATCGHFTDMIWQSNTQLGCFSQKSCNGRFCNKLPQGNYVQVCRMKFTGPASQVMETAENYKKYTKGKRFTEAECEAKIPGPQC